MTSLDEPDDTHDRAPPVLSVESSFHNVARSKGGIFPNGDFMRSGVPNQRSAQVLLPVARKAKPHKEGRLEATEWMSCREQLALDLLLRNVCPTQVGQFHPGRACEPWFSGSAARAI
jgi:hypothetical protein